MRDAVAAPSMAYVFTIDVALQPPIVLTESPRGRRVYIPIVGGTVRGPRIRAEIIPGGGDRAVERAGDVMDIHANYLVRTTTTLSSRSTTEGTGVSVPDRSPYFVTAPVFATDDDRYRWLTRGVFLGMAHEVDETRIVIDVYAAATAEVVAAEERDDMRATLPDLFADRSPSPDAAFLARARTAE